MALSKSVTMPTGAVAEYWSLISMQSVIGSGTCNAYLGGYVSSAVQSSGSSPLQTRFFAFTAADLGVSDITAATQAEVYAAILATVNASGSTDPLNGATTA
ncbi:hypothetical protein [Gluconobacter thailandicus]|uniref:Uncharacterized protein n=1 Tax=Gluconobacter thailandicus TaxID=257438 RepID=A0AAP9JJC7_GLUTH|nr:hypothetical protein [Gluconobacter thailandicus]QEH97264.1 hypothetical protein FXF46_14165 [Gluconobacter thailandicus]